MVYIIATVCIVICIVIIVFGLNVLKENRKMLPRKKKAEEEDDIRF